MKQKIPTEHLFYNYIFVASSNQPIFLHQNNMEQQSGAHQIWRIYAWKKRLGCQNRFHISFKRVIKPFRPVYNPYVAHNI